MDPDLLHRRREAILNRLRGLRRVVVAYSGGVDSTLVARLAFEALGDGALAVTAAAETMPQRELEDARRFAAAIGIRHRIIETHELAIAGYAENSPNRCYLCKKDLHSHLTALARAEGFEAVVDGTNIDDLGDVRPGLEAARELGIVSPFVEAGCSKADVRELARALDLECAEKPAAACLSSRFPPGTKITQEGLAQVEKAEDVLHELGLVASRVRHHDSLARIEVPPDEIPRVASEEVRREIVRRLRALGYAFVTLDLEGYRSGGRTLAADETACAPCPPATGMQV